MIGAYHATGIAITVVFVGTTAIPAECFKGGIELQGKPDTGQIDQIRGEHDVGADAQATSVGQGIGMGGLDVVPALAARGTGAYFDAVLTCWGDNWLYGGDAVL